MKPVKTIERLRSKTSTTIVALGDSLTYGWMVERGYLDFLEEMIAETYPGSILNLVNRGISGDTAAGGLHRLERDVMALIPDCVFVQFALNDAFSGYSSDEYRKYIEMIIKKIVSRLDADIVLVTSVCLDDNQQDELMRIYYEELDALAERFRLPIVKVHEYWKSKISEGMDFTDLTLYDGAHPNEKGYQLMAEAIMQLFI